MLKSQDILVTLKILGFEEYSEATKVTTMRLQGRTWLNLNESVEIASSYDLDNDELVVSDEPDDFEQKDLETIRDYLDQFEATTNTGWTYRSLAKQLFISVSEANQSVKRCLAAGLLYQVGRGPVRTNRPVLYNFIRYGVGVSFYAEKGKVARGIPTSIAAPAFKTRFLSSDMPPVWPCARGAVKGVAITPIYKSVVKAVMIDSWLYEQLALIDIFRIGTAREREEVLPLLDNLRVKK